MKHYLLIEKVPRVLISSIYRLLPIDKEWAKQWRKNRLEHEKNYENIITILITWENIFIWEMNLSSDDLPNVILDTNKCLFKYYKRIDAKIIESEKPSNGAFDFAVWKWLDDLMNGNNSDEEIKIFKDFRKFEVLPEYS